MSTIRVLLADDHVLVRSGIRRLLEEMGGFEVVAEADDGAQAIEAAQRERPDVAVLDGSMPELNGLEAAAWMRDNLPQVRVILLTMHADDGYVRAALEAGAAGFLVKRSAPEELAVALRAVVAGHTYLSPAVSRTLIEERVGGPRPQLTPRQREVLKLVAEGRSSREIAVHLSLSVRTVESHRADIMRRLGADDVTGLVRHAVRMGLVRVDPGGE